MIKSFLLNFFAITATGLMAGLAGIILTIILHEVQYLAYGYNNISDIPFMQAVSNSTPLRRILAITASGMIAGFGWWMLNRFGRKRLPIRLALISPSLSMPFITTTLHALLQIITVALGSPLGREVAPREMGALAGMAVSRSLNLSSDEVRTLIACGAGAGLAAVYNVPLAGALFSLEVLLRTFHWKKVIAAMITASMAAWVATFGLGEVSQYHFNSTELSSSFFILSLMAGPVLGALGWGFRVATTKARQGVKCNWQMPTICFISFFSLALASIYFPELPGNGKGPLQLAITGSINADKAILLLILKTIFILAILRGGAEGGLLTPGLTVGALLSLIIFSLCSSFIADGNAESFALIGSAAFLAASMSMPLTAVVLAMEFTQMNHDYMYPLLICVASSFATSKIIDRKTALKT